MGTLSISKIKKIISNDSKRRELILQEKQYYENDNDINDLTNSADFYNNSQNGIGSFPLMMSDRNKEILNKNKINK